MYDEALGKVILSPDIDKITFCCEVTDTTARGDLLTILGLLGSTRGLSDYKQSKPSPLEIMYEYVPRPLK